MALYPLTFRPIFKERVWGGRALEQLYQKQLPPEVPIGESWEISDRPGDVSIIANGALAGKDLRWLMENHRVELLGIGAPAERFPLLIKILDARETLSLQVHPPADKATSLGGEPKTELWYVARADPGAELFVGLKHGVTRNTFENQIASGKVADCFHRIRVKAGDAMFLPSGRVHALGGGLVIFEIQQNSDTTYRVFDWNRPGLDGRPRPLHLEQSFASIDFEDFEPGLVNAAFGADASVKKRLLVDDPLFSVEEINSCTRQEFPLKIRTATIIALLEGRIGIGDGPTRVTLEPGGFSLLPAALADVSIQTEAPWRLLISRL